MSDAAIGGAGGAPPAGGGDVVVQIRKNFQETALWLPDVVTDATGRAQLEFQYPDNLTNWRAVGRGASQGADFGIARDESATRLPLLVRLQAPRFFVVGDEVVISLNVDNRTDEPLKAQVELEIDGLETLGFLAEGHLRASVPAQVDVPANDGVRLDWKVRVSEIGTAKFVARVRGGEHSDGLELELPIEPHGIQSQILRAGRFDGAGVEVHLELPSARAEGTTEFEVSVTPSLAVTMLDALPYLVQYPYGCTEQTLSRFVPTAVVKSTLEQLGLDPELAMNRVWGGIEAEFSEKTQRTPHAGLDQLDRATREGLDRLYDLQHGDGSWSWWKHGDGDRFMTAYVVWGLSLAREAGVAVDTGKLEAAAVWLGRELVGAKKDPELQAWMLHAHTAWLGRTRGEQRKFADAACENLLEKRTALGTYARALLALSCSQLERKDDAALLAQNLIDGVLRDDAPDSSIIPMGGATGGTQSPRAH